jgi:hypothetical protein
VCTQNYDPIRFLSLRNYESLHLHFVSGTHDEYFYVEKDKKECFVILEIYLFKGIFPVE